MTTLATIKNRLNRIIQDHPRLKKTDLSKLDAEEMTDRQILLEVWRLDCDAARAKGRQPPKKSDYLNLSDARLAAMLAEAG